MVGMKKRGINPVRKDEALNTALSKKNRRIIDPV